MLVSDNIRKCVAFIGLRDANNRFIPKATCFFVGLVERKFHFYYLITADHVVAQLRATGRDIWLRSNQIDGSVQEIILPPEGWIHFAYKNSTDVAAMPIRITPEEDIHVINLFGVDDRHMIVDPKTIAEKNIGIGEEIIIVGMFRSHYGLNRNIPVVRIGNIAAMLEEPVPTKEYGYVEAYLVEARSIGGLSGSPVFVSMPPFRSIEGKIAAAIGPQYYLLGLMHGHFDIPDMNADVVADDIGDYGAINTGIGVVIPATKIKELLTQDFLLKGRNEAIEKHLAIVGATPDS